MEQTAYASTIEALGRPPLPEGFTWLPYGGESHDLYRQHLYRRGRAFHAAAEPAADDDYEVVGGAGDAASGSASSAEFEIVGHEAPQCPEPEAEPEAPAAPEWAFGGHVHEASLLRVREMGFDVTAETAAALEARGGDLNALLDTLFAAV